MSTMVSLLVYLSQGKVADCADDSGYTPLTAAVEGRRWSTAKVILAVATAQYHPHDKKDRIKFHLNIKLGNVMN